MSHRCFTVAEANALIPALESAVEQVVREKEEVNRHHEKLQLLDVLWGDRLLDEENPDHEEAMGHRAAILASVQEIERVVQSEILARGLRFPEGGLEHGLVDFPTTWEGRWVYLCWRQGEPAITAWHEVDAGFAGRQPLTEEQARRMGREDDPTRLDDSMLDF